MLGAKVLEQERDYGAVEARKKSHLVIFDRDPVEDPRSILGRNPFTKDGRVVPK